MLTLLCIFFAILTVFYAALAVYYKRKNSEMEQVYINLLMKLGELDKNE